MPRLRKSAAAASSESAFFTPALTAAVRTMDDDASGDTTNPLNVESNLTEPLTGADEVVLDGRTRGPSVDDDALYAVLSRRRAVGLMVTRWIYVCSAGLALALGLPAMIYSLAVSDAEGRAYLLPVSATFAGAAVPVALYGVYTHVNNYWRPVLQVYVTRILWMVPVYAVCSLAELVLWLEVEQGCGECRRWTAVPGALRDCYESYTVLNFFYFMVTFLEVHYGGAAEKVLREGIKKPAADDDDDDEDLAVPHPCPPYRWFCSPWRLDSPEFLGQCRYGVLLYATIMPLCAAVYIVSAFAGGNNNYDDDDAADRDEASLRGALASPSSWAYFVAFNTANHAIYCLGLFFYAAHDLLLPCHPHGKFVAVKGLVFGTFFQDLGIDAVFYCSPGLATKFGATQDDATAALGALKCTLMCVEMLAFALLHAHAFPASQYPRVRLESPEDAENPSISWLAAWGDYYAQQKRERRLARARGLPRPNDGFSPAATLFDVTDVRRDTAATARGLATAPLRVVRNARSAPALAQFNRLSLGRMTAQAAQRAAGSPRVV